VRFDEEVQGVLSFALVRPGQSTLYYEYYQESDGRWYYHVLRVTDGRRLVCGYAKDGVEAQEKLQTRYNRDRQRMQNRVLK
jgi:hypothetical protein